MVRIPQETIDELEIVYRMRRTTVFAERGDLLIAEAKNTAFTGELVVLGWRFCFPAKVAASFSTLTFREGLFKSPA